MTAHPTSPARTVALPDAVTVKGLAERLGISPIEAIKRLMTHGVMAAMNDTIDYETAALVAADLGVAPERMGAPDAVAAAVRESGGEAGADEAGAPRPPVVTILGHVDHGKTSLLDAIRETNVVAGEAGGITQHIGAYQIEREGGGPVTFIDTPGHAAFTAMRARGAQVTDIAIVVVAADDGVMPQTAEAIDHARAADVPMIVAINKTDLPAANPDRVKQQLTEHSVVVEEYGGEVLAVPVSAATGAGLGDLVEAIDLVAELQELRANPDRPASGAVIEAELDPRRGPLATVLVQNGVLRPGDALVTGFVSGKVKAMFDERGARLSEAGPSRPVRVMGLEDVPVAGDAIRVVEDERTARRLVEEARRAAEGAGASRGRVTLDTLFNEVSAGNVKELVLILKADVRGSVEAVRGALQGLGGEGVKVKVIHSATGAVSESDVMLASASGAIVLAFNVKTEPSAAREAEASGVEIRTYEVIYQLIESVEQALEGLYEPVYERVVDGVAEVRQLFRSSRVGRIAGCYVTEGALRRNSRIRVLRNGEELADVGCGGLRRFQDDVREVQQGFECGVVLDGFGGFAEGDLLEFYHQQRVN